MKTKTITPAVFLLVASGISACGSRPAEGIEADPEIPGDSMVEGAAAPSSFVERAFWLALAEEPGWHLDRARELFMDGQTEMASQEFSKVAAILNFETRHSHAPREQGLLLGSVQELREVARQLRYQEVPYEGVPSVEELDRVSALAFRTIAAHQVALARDALEAGDPHVAGRYITETTRAVENGFHRCGTDMGNAMRRELAHSKEVAARMEMEGNGSRDESLATLDDLDAAVNGLSEVLTSGRK
jgi:hypothetical protein